MDLPPLLRRAIDDALNGTALSDLAARPPPCHSATVKSGMTQNIRISDREALAYLAVRLPATYAADPRQL